MCRECFRGGVGEVGRELSPAPPNARPGLLPIHGRQRLIWSHTARAGSADVHTQAKSCRASQWAVTYFI